MQKHPEGVHGVQGGLEPLWPQAYIGQLTYGLQIWLFKTVVQSVWKSRVHMVDIEVSWRLSGPHAHMSYGVAAEVLEKSMRNNQKKHAVNRSACRIKCCCCEPWLPALIRSVLWHSLVMLLT